jgi:hypothetical protein
MVGFSLGHIMDLPLKDEYFAFSFSSSLPLDPTN